MTFDQFLILLGIIIFVTLLGFRVVMGKKNNESKDSVLDKIRVDFVNIIAKFAPLILEADDEEGRDEAFNKMVDMFHRFIDETDLLTPAEKDIVRLFDIKSLIISMEDMLIEQGILLETVEEIGVKKE